MSFKETRTIMIFTKKRIHFPQTYLHMSVESWVPRLYIAEAILLMSSAAPETKAEL